MTQALQGAILFDRFPKSEVDVFILVLEVSFTILRKCLIGAEEKEWGMDTDALTAWRGRL